MRAEIRPHADSGAARPGRRPCMRPNPVRRPSITGRHDSPNRILGGRRGAQDHSRFPQDRSRLRRRAWARRRAGADRRQFAAVAGLLRLAEERARAPDRPADARAHDLRVDQGRPHGGLLPRGRPGDQIRDSQGGAQRSEEAGDAGSRGAGGHGGPGAGLSGGLRRFRRSPRRLAHPAGHRHRLRLGGLRRRRPPPALLAADFPADPRHRRRPRGDRPDRRSVLERRELGPGAVDRRPAAGQRRAGPAGQDSRPLLGAGFRPGLVPDRTLRPVHLADGGGLRRHRACRPPAQRRPEPAARGDA